MTASADAWGAGEDVPEIPEIPDIRGSAWAAGTVPAPAAAVPSATARARQVL
jgi:hypothetical protein